MKKTITLALVSFLFTACAAVAKQPTQGTASGTTTTEDHEAHHPAEAATNKAESTKANGEMGSDMMGKVDMSQMKGMMDQCMSMHKDGKMCDHETMKSCEANMKQGECEKMMKQAKGKEKAKKS
jgi:hypothetical protein